MLIGLTGGIASGKSTVAQFLKSFGYAVIDADLVGHQLLLPGTPSYQTVVERFGPLILNQDQMIDRRALGTLVFADSSERHWLEALLHPMIAKEIEQSILEAMPQTKNQIVFLEAAVLIEAHWHSRCDQVWTIEVEPSLAIQRMHQRNQLTRDQAQARLNAQLSNEQRRSYAQYVIGNNGSLTKLRTQVQRELGRINSDLSPK